MPSRRAIPDRAMPDRVTVEPCVGFSATGPVYGEPIEGVRGNLNARRGRATTLEVGQSGWSVEKVGEVILDPVTLPPLSRVTNEATGYSQTVGMVVEFDQPPVQRFLVAALGQLYRSEAG